MVFLIKAQPDMQLLCQRSLYSQLPKTPNSLKQKETGSRSAGPCLHAHSVFINLACGSQPAGLGQVSQEQAQLSSGPHWGGDAGAVGSGSEGSPYWGSTVSPQMSQTRMFWSHLEAISSQGGVQGAGCQPQTLTLGHVRLTDTACQECHVFAASVQGLRIHGPLAIDLTQIQI